MNQQIAQNTSPRFFLTKEAEDEHKKLQALQATIRAELAEFGEKIVAMQDIVDDMQRLRQRLAALARGIASD